MSSNAGRSWNSRPRESLFRVRHGTHGQEDDVHAPAPRCNRSAYFPGGAGQGSGGTEKASIKAISRVPRALCEMPLSRGQDVVEYAIAGDMWPIACCVTARGKQGDV